MPLDVDNLIEKLTLILVSYVWIDAIATKLSFRY